MTGDGLRFALRGESSAALETLRALEHGADAHVQLASARRQEFAQWRFNRRASIAGRIAARVRVAAIGARWAALAPPHDPIAGDLRAA